MDNTDVTLKNAPLKMAEEMKPDGLQLIFRAGEMLPLKNVWFEVEKVGKDYMVLQPKSTTGAFQKRKARGEKA